MTLADQQASMTEGNTATESKLLSVVFINHKTWQQPHVRPQPGSIGEATIENFLEYLEAPERIEFFNELSDAMAVDSKVHITVPYYSHSQALSNWCIKPPGFTEHSFLFLSKHWRAERPQYYTAPYQCNFALVNFEYDMVSDWTTRHDFVRSFGVAHYLGTVTRLYVTLIKLSGEPIKS